jgi:hypothetical protein
MIEQVPANKPATPKPAFNQPGNSERDGANAQSGNPP